MKNGELLWGVEAGQLELTSQALQMQSVERQSSHPEKRKNKKL